MKLNELQRANIRVILDTVYAVAEEQGWSAEAADHAGVITLSTGYKESRLGSDPSTYSPDKNEDSGIFQQRTIAGWYSQKLTLEERLAELHDTVFATRAFLLGAKVTQEAYDQAKKDGQGAAGDPGYRVPGVARIKNWQTKTVSEVSHAVQRSAFATVPEDFIVMAKEQIALYKNEPPTEEPPMAELTKPQQVSRNGWQMSKPGAQRKLVELLAYLRSKGHEIKTVYGYVAGTNSHVDGMTWDVMLPYSGAKQKAVGELIVDFLWGNKERRKGWQLHYIVHRDRIFSTTPGKGGEDGLPFTKDRTHFYHTHNTNKGDAYVEVAWEGDVTPPPAPPEPPAHLELVPGGKITTDFGVKGEWEAGFHPGIDINVVDTDDYGRPCRTVKPCKVISVGGNGWGSAYGRKQVIVQYEDGRRGLYAHMSATASGVVKGAELPAGYDVGRIGWSGNVRPKSRAGSHLHYEERVKPYRYGEDARRPLLPIEGEPTA